jgi:hypothetical protein
VLLAVAAFSLRWRFVVALPIAVVLFTVAAFSSPSKVRQQRRTRSLDHQPMTRPVGITVIALLNILGGFAVGLSEMLSTDRPERGLAGMLFAGVIPAFALVLPCSDCKTGPVGGRRSALRAIADTHARPRNRCA